MILVSIPYEREGTFRLIIPPPLVEDPKKIILFQFPTSGKAHSDRRCSSTACTIREEWSGVQFPTSGKAHSDFGALR